MDWSELMQAPWGKHDEKSKELKKEALERYSREFKEWCIRKGIEYNEV